MRVIDESQVRRAARRLTAKGDAARRRAQLLGALRPELVAYVVAATRPLSTSAQAAAWRGLELACEAMGAIGRLEGRASVEDVLAAHARNLDLAIAIGAAHPRFADRWLACSGELRQRALLRRLSASADRSVPAGERGAVFLLLKSVVDVLDQHAPAGASAPPPETGAA